MRVIYVDDEKLAVTKFSLTAKKIPDISELHTFESGAAALEFVRSHQVDTAFLDIEMPGMSGLELARAMQQVNESIRVFFVTAYDHYALDAFGADAMGYLLKPYSLDMLRQQVMKAKRVRNVPKHTVYIQTMPMFDVFIDGELFPINSPKPRELLALLVDRNGASVTTGQAISVLWEDRMDDEKTRTLYRMTVKRLKEILAAAGIDFILSGEGATKFIRTDTFACDYVRFLRNDQEAVLKYHGEYMSEYAWAEDTNARLTFMKQEMLDK